MVSKRSLQNKLILIVTSLIFLFLSGNCFAAPFTIDLGEDNSMVAVTEAWQKLPDPAKSQAVICHAENTYKLRCGEAPDPKPLEGMLEPLKTAGFAPSIIQEDVSGCVPAQQFVETFCSEKPPDPPNDLQKAENASSDLTEKPLAARLMPKKNEYDINSRKLEMAKAIPDIEPPYADLHDPNVTQYENSTAMMVRPDVATQVLMSNRDINRIICESGAIKDVVYSREKGIDVKIDGDNAFVKFLINGNTATGGISYATVPSEFYVVCGTAGDVYTLVASPKNIPAQTISLTSPRKNLDKNLSLFKGIPFEDMVVSLIKDAYTDKIPDSFTVKPVNRSVNVFRDVDVFLKRKVIIDGEGLILNEYDLTLKPSAPETEKTVEEKNFLVPELTQNPVGISLEHLTVKKEHPTRLFIVEKHNQENDQ